MKKIVKRFELISVAISLEENEIIDSQIRKLRTFRLSKEAESIVNLLEHRSYEQATTRIKTYIKKISDISAYKDPKIGELQVQLQTLERDFYKLSETKNEYVANILEYTALYHKILDPILDEILTKKFKNAKDAYDKGKIDTKLYESVQKHYNAFQESRRVYEKDSHFYLSSDEKNELKELYLKANKKINPDTLLEHFRQRTQKMYIALNNAYKKRDLATIRKIKKTIDQNPNAVYGFDRVDNVETLRKQSRDLRKKINQLQTGLDAIKESKIYSLLNSVENFEFYFNNLKKRLANKKERLSQVF